MRCRSFGVFAVQCGLLAGMALLPPLTAGERKSGEQCGGLAGIPCDKGEFCKLPPGDCCCDFFGLCTTIPDGCPEIWDPVCGCDGTTYGNECEADAAGVSVNHPGECVTSGACCVDIDDGPVSFDTCLVMDPASCENWAGIYHAETTSCEAVQACCFADAGACVEMNPLCCLDSGGVPLAGSLGCSDVVCTTVIFSDGFESGDITAWSSTEPRCGNLSELQCIDSGVCTLVLVGETTGEYVCRAAEGVCEPGFRQRSDTAESCEAKEGCRFVPGVCYCPPDLVCVCGGGPPPQCVQSP